MCFYTLNYKCLSMIQCLNPFGEPEVVYLPLELAEVTKTIGNFDNEKLVNSKYYGILNYT